MIFAMRSIGRIEHQILALALPAATAQILLVVSVQDETEVSVFVRMPTQPESWGVFQHARGKMGRFELQHRPAKKSPGR
jgi:hypothetical protein